MTFTKYTGRHAKMERTVQVRFSADKSSFIEIASRAIKILNDYVTYARLRRRR
ncbi:MAG: hypothetical protein ABSF00_01800 [Candidatus Bathyarchaeia archaeon]|jgi:ribosomal protein L31E